MSNNEKSPVRLLTNGNYAGCDLIGKKVYDYRFYDDDGSIFISGDILNLIGKEKNNRVFLDGTDYCFSADSFEFVEEENTLIMPEQDKVNSPSHYMIGGIETIEIIETMLTKEEFEGYCKGNIIKYRERAQHKGTAEQDYAKAKKYMEFLKKAQNRGQGE